ncbi:MAG TPA: winged helix-turn-helix domain-containing protein [Blastocatellia bacterium]|nr:winged helix-turn-helix domain-containing protein [Blastocatellia bacterium]
MGESNNYEGLRFACDCVSAKGAYSDPWAGVAKNKLLPNGTKEDILNSVYKQPKTVAQIAKELDLSQPTIHRHINEMMASELLRESEEWERKYPTERYYEPNFPVVKAEERAEFEAICRQMAEAVVELFEKRRKQLEGAFDKTDLAEQGWAFADITQYLYASMQRAAREMLEQRGALPQREKHNNGAEWIFWAEEAGSKE